MHRLATSAPPTVPGLLKLCPGLGAARGCVGDSSLVGGRLRGARYVSSQHSPDGEDKTVNKLLGLIRRPQFHSLGGVRQDGRKEVEDWNDVLNRWYQNYQDFVGITDLKNAQDKVTELSEVLLGTQSRRRELQAEIEQLQEKHMLNQQRITKTELYSDEHYRLFDEAREMNGRMKTLRAEFERSEQVERDTYAQLSAAIRDCHERERFQAEQSKYWSIIASVVSAALASVITSVNNWVRIREVKDHVTQTTQDLEEGYKEAMGQVLSSIAALEEEAQRQQHQQQQFVDKIVMASAAAQSTVTSDSHPVKEVMIPQEIPSDAVSERTPVDNKDMTIIKDILEDTNSNVSRLGEAVETLREELSAAAKVSELSVREHLQAVLSEERSRAFQELNSQLETALAKLLLTPGKEVEEELVMKDEGDKPRKSIPLVWENIEESEVVMVDYSYRRIATAMAVGAGIGTLVTAFMLGSFPGTG